jgi:hypothetical protein
MAVGVVLQTWWVAVGTLVIGTLLLIAEWLWLRRSGATPAVADEPTAPRWPEDPSVGRDVIGSAAATIAKAALLVGIALLSGLLLGHAAFSEVAGGALATGILQIRHSRRAPRTAAPSIAGL